MPRKRGFVYIITNHYNTTLYTGVTNNLARRINEHKTLYNPKSFSAAYNLNKLVYFEEFDRIEEAIKREKQLKRWRRIWKEKLISEKNPDWIDLFPEHIPDDLFWV